MSLVPALGAPDAPETPPQYAIAPAPDWVKPLDPDAVPVPASTAVEDGIDYLLVDHQQTMSPRASFSHYTQRIINEHGLQNGSEINTEFDPSFETLTLHWLKVKRDGVWQDRLATEKFQVLHREENLDSQMLDGRYSVICHLQDVRVGDVIDFACTVTGENPVFNGKVAYSFSTTWGNPVHLFSHQLLTAPNRPISLKSFADTIEPVRTKNPDGSELLVWKKTEVPATFEDARTPDWYDTYGKVQISEYASWKEVVDWGLSTYPFDAPIGKELQDKIDEIAKAQTNPEDRALAVLAFVQNDIRYLGIEMGANSYKPTPSSLVCEHRFGDCKDKSLLCVVMLRALGLEAYPVLVNTEYRQETARMLPSPLAFDHAIVQLILDNRTYWLDATRTGQRNRLKDFFIGDYQQALVLKAGVDGLVPMTVSPESLPRETIEDTFTVKSVEAPVPFQVHSIYRGQAAENMRAMLDRTSREKVEKDNLTYYAGHYTKIKIGKPLHFQDFPDDNRLEVWEDYVISDFWTRETPTSEWKGVFTPWSISDTIGSVPSPQRTAPYRLDHPTDVSENMEIDMFDDWNVGLKTREVTLPGFTFSKKPWANKNIVHFDYHYQTLAPEVSVAGMADYHDKVKDILDHLDYNLTYRPATAAAPSAPEPFRPNWMIIVLMTLIFGVSCYLAFRLYMLPRPMPPLTLPMELHLYEGLGGWLVLVVIGIVLRLILYGKAVVVNYSVAWDLTKWNVLTVPGTDRYSPFWAPTLLFELSFTCLFLILLVLSLVLMVQKRALFPKVMIAGFALSLIFSVIDVTLANQIPFLVKEHGSLYNDGDLWRVGLQCAIWIPYFLVSKRVRATFRF